jgi:ankyrin repeat protein
MTSMSLLHAFSMVKCPVLGHTKLPRTLCASLSEVLLSNPRCQQFESALSLTVLHQELDFVCSKQISWISQLPEVSHRARELFRKWLQACKDFREILARLGQPFGSIYAWPMAFTENPRSFHDTWWPLYAEDEKTWLLSDRTGFLALYGIIAGLTGQDAPSSLQPGRTERVSLINQITNFLRDKEVQDGHGRSALHMAIQADLTELAIILIREHRGIYSTDTFGRSPLHYVVMALNRTVFRDLTVEDSNIFKLLLEQGADPNHRDCQDRSILEYLFQQYQLYPRAWRSAMYNHYLLLLIGLNHLDVNALLSKDFSIFRVTPLMAAMESQWPEGVSAIAARKDVDFTSTDIRGWTILHTHAKMNETTDLEYTTMPIDYRLQNLDDIPSCHFVEALVNQQDHNGATALCRVSEYGSKHGLQVARRLLGVANIRADIADNNGYTPLHHAASRGDTDLRKLLCDRADSGLTARTSIGETAAELARQMKKLKAHSVLQEAEIKLLSGGN